MRGDDRRQLRMTLSAGDGAEAYSDVVLDLLEELRAARYAPTGWARFAARSWHQGARLRGRIRG